MDDCHYGAISKVPLTVTHKQPKQEAVCAALRALLASKANQEAAMDAVIGRPASPVEAQLARALKESIRIVAEDMLRDSGYMLPQSEQARAALLGMLEREQDADIPSDAAEELLRMLES